MKSTLVVLIVAVVGANAAVVPLGYTLAPKIPVTTTVPMVTNVPITIPSCGCGVELELASVQTYGFLEPVFPPAVLPTCGCVERVLPGCGLELSTISCGCGFELPSCGCGCRSGCLAVDPVTTCGCTLPVSVLDTVPTLNPFLGVVPACGCGCGRVVSACGCPTLPPVAPVVGCCGKYLRKVCVQPPFL